jgi:hypothetical protein
VASRAALLAAAVVVAAVGCASSPTKVAPTTTGPTASTGTGTTIRAPVPAAHRALYDHLSAQLDAYQHAVDAMPVSPATVAPTRATELLPANGNRLRALLTPTAVVAADTWLDRLQKLGIGGVTLGIKVPMLLPQFGPDADAYTRFYATVAEHARARHLTVDVELGELFCGTPFASCSYSYRGTYDAFVRATVDQARIVIDRVRPAYLTVLAEPTTEAALAGIPSLASQDGAVRYVVDVLAGIGPRGTTKVGAGAATWLPSSYDAALLRTSIDYLDVHVYPITASMTATLLEDTALAHAAGKPIVMDETWLYKTDDLRSATPATSDRVFRLDSFSFFEPLDVRFLEITAAWARKAGAAYVSPFWAGQFFSYVDWTPALDVAPFATLNQAFDEQVRRAFTAGTTTETGRTWTKAFSSSGA